MNTKLTAILIAAAILLPGCTADPPTTPAVTQETTGTTVTTTAPIETTSPETEESTESAKVTEPPAETEEYPLGFKVEDGDSPIKADTYSALLFRKYRAVYDLDHLYVMFGDEPATADDVIQRIKNNPGIPEKYHEFLETFVRRLSEAHPDFDLRVLSNNLKSLKLIEVSKEYLADTYGASGIYFHRNNEILIVEGPVPEIGSFEYNVLYHELCHAARLLYRMVDTNTYEVMTAPYERELVTCLEALNTMFSVSVMDDETPYIPYRLLTNCYGVMLSCIEDEHSLADCFSASQTELAGWLDEYSGDTNYAYTMMRLLDAHYDDLSDDSYSRDFEAYRPVYEYVARMYYRDRVTDGMTADEGDALADELYGIITDGIDAFFGEGVIDESLFHEVMNDVIG